MPFETTDVASKVGGTQFDPAKTIGEYANIQNQFNQNKLFQAKSLAGQYLARSTGPDGTPDLGQFTQAIQNDSRTGPFAADILADAQQLHGAGITNRQNTQNLAASGIANLRKVAGTAGVSSPTGDATENKNNAIKAILGGIGTLYTQDQAADFLGNLGDNVRASVISGDAGTAAQTALTGTPETVSTGAHNKAVSVNPFINTRQDMSGNAADVAMETSPEFKGTRVGGINPQTQESFTVPQGSVTQPSGEGKVVPGLTGQHGEIQTGLAPGEAEAAAVPKKAAADQLADLNTTAAGSMNRKTLLKELLSAQGDFRSGPGAGKWSTFVTEANRILGTNFDGSSVPSQQVFSKIAAQLTAQQLKTSGLAPTNEQAQLAQLMNPSNEYSPEANKQVAAILLGNEDLIQAKEAAAKHWTGRGGKASNFNDFQTEFNNAADPRYFQEQYMTPQQVQQMHKSMSPTELKRYNTRKTFFLEQAKKWEQ